MMKRHELPEIKQKSVSDFFHIINMRQFLSFVFKNLKAELPIFFPKSNLYI